LKIKKANHLTLPPNPSIDEWEKIEEDFGNRWSSKHFNWTVVYPYVQYGDIVEEEIVNYFASVDVPITINSNLVQCGKWAGKGFNDSTRKAGRIYFTFKKENENWIYCGKCFVGETKQRYEDILVDDMERLWAWDIKRLEAFVRDEFEWFRKVREGCESVPWRLYYHWDFPL
jgi:hypothetical protein